MGSDRLVHKPRFPLRQMLTVGLMPPLLKNGYYRIVGARIGSGTSIGLGSVIVADEIEVGDGVQIGFGSYLRARKVVIGSFARVGSGTFVDAETISIGEDAKISEQVYVGGLSSPSSHFHLGARTTLMQHTFVNVARPVTIGDDTGIGGKCTIFTHGSWQNALDGYPVTFASVTIGNNVWIPWQVFIMPGVTIGDGATIGAGSLVTKDIPAGALAVGSPAKVVRTADQYPVKPNPTQRKEMLRSMIEEFSHYLHHEGLNTNCGWEEQQEIQLVTVTDMRNLSNTLLVCYGGQVIPPDPSRYQVVLSLEGVSENDRKVLWDRGRMWLDISNKERGGVSNPLGEELAEFIKRYGLRFSRIG